MADAPPIRVWTMRLAFVGVTLLILFFHLIPLETTPRRWAAPDLLTAFVFAWALRRPDYVPAILIALVMLLADLLLQRPPGLWAALVLVGAELMKANTARETENTFLVEWVSVSGMLGLITVLYHLILTVLIVSPGGAIWLGAVQLAMTVLLYPLVVLVSQVVFGIKRPAPGDLDRRGKLA